MAVTLPESGDTAFIPEVWGLYSVGVLVLLLRFAVRMKTVGVKGFQGDDWISILTLILYTMDAVTVHIIFYIGSNVEAVAVAKTQTLTADDIANFILGSQLQLTAWYSYTALIWSLKAAMLFFFHRLTIGLWQHKWIRWIGLVCGVTYLAVALTITFGCFPTHRNWQVVPDPGEKCTLKLQNFLVTVTLNVITDAMILAVPVPLLWTLRIPKRQKTVIALLLCSGLFVIAAAIIRVALTLDSNPSATNINRWGVRETIVGIITVNAPILRPMFSKNFWSTSGWKSSSLSYGNSRNLDGKSGAAPTGKGFELSSTTGGRTEHGSPGGKKDGAWDDARELDVENGMKKQRRASASTLVSQNASMTGSEEYIMRSAKGNGMEVNVHTEFTISTENGDGSGQRAEEWQRGKSGSRSGFR